MKATCTFILLSLCSMVFSQKYEVTPQGMLNSSDKTKSFLVIEINDKTALQLYDGVIKYINKNYKNPEAVIKGQTKGEFISFESYTPNLIFVKNGMAKVPFSAKYRTEISFKDGKAKYEITNLDIKNDSNYPLLWTKSGMNFGIYNKKGELKLPDTKTEIENYFNTQIENIIDSMKGSTTDENW